MTTKESGARLTFRTTKRVDEVLRDHARRTCRTKNSIVNEAVHLYVAERILHCSLEELQRDEGDDP